MTDVAHIAVAASSIPASRQLVPMPSFNPSVGGTLEIVGYKHAGFMLAYADPSGAPVWSMFLAGDGADVDFVAAVRNGF